MTILLYHNPDPDSFASHLDALREHYSLISLRSFLASIDSNGAEPLPPRSLIITFDDGHKNNYLLLGLFREFDVVPTIFLCSGIIGTNRHFWFSEVGDAAPFKHIPDAERLERLRAQGFEEERAFGKRQALTREEIDEMRGAVDFQSHTVSHPILPHCSTEKARREVAESKRALEREYGFDVYAVAYPNGDYGDREIEFAAESGYLLGLTVDYGFNSPLSDPFRLKRIPIPDGASAEEVLVRASGVWDLAKRGLARVTP